MAQGEKLISVIVTAYNIEAYLPRCMESLLAQTYSPVEIILVDDGSTDGTGRLCDQYAGTCPNVTVIHQENAGPSAARNSGLAAAKGDYIGYVDGDDWVEPRMYEDMLAACLKSGAQVAVCTYRQVGEGAEKINPTGKLFELSREEALEIYICDNRPFHIYHSVWSKLFERSLVEGIRFTPGRKSEDIMYTTQALTRASRCVYLDTAYYNYVVDRNDSIMNSKLYERRFQDEIPFWKEQIGYLYGLGMKELAEKSAYQFYRRMLFYYVDFRDCRMKKAGEELMGLLRNERPEIARIYRKPFAAVGDKVRMRLALAWPGGYYHIVKFYDRVIVPLRQ